MTAAIYAPTPVELDKRLTRGLTDPVITAAARRAYAMYVNSLSPAWLRADHVNREAHAVEGELADIRERVHWLVPLTHDPRVSHVRDVDDLVVAFTFNHTPCRLWFRQGDSQHDVMVTIGTSSPDIVDDPNDLLDWLERQTTR